MTQEHFQQIFSDFSPHNFPDFAGAGAFMRETQEEGKPANSETTADVFEALAIVWQVDPIEAYLIWSTLTAYQSLVEQTLLDTDLQRATQSIQGRAWQIYQMVEENFVTDLEEIEPLDFKERRLPKSEPEQREKAAKREFFYKEMREQLQKLAQENGFDYAELLSQYQATESFLQYRGDQPLTEEDFIFDIFQKGNLQLGSKKMLSEILQVGFYTLLSELDLQ